MENAQRTLKLGASTRSHTAARTHASTRCCSELGSSDALQHNFACWDNLLVCAALVQTCEHQQGFWLLTYRCSKCSDQCTLPVTFTGQVRDSGMQRDDTICALNVFQHYFFKLNDTAQWQLSCSRSQSAQLDVKSSPSSVIQHTYNADIVVLRGIHCGRALHSFPLTTVISNSLTDTVGWNYQSVPEKCCEINHKNNKSALKCAWGWFRLFSITDQVFTWLSSWDDNSHCKQETNVVSVQEFDTARHRLTG